MTRQSPGHLCGQPPRQPLRLAVREAERILANAGVASPRVDAELLAAHVLGIERGRLPMIPLVDQATVAELSRLVQRRAKREPLQYLTGQASMGGITVSVGPGVFVPRPETELLLGWALAILEGRHHHADQPSHADQHGQVGQHGPVVVDLCTGSAVLALAVANARPDAVVHAVERDPSALSWARRNANHRAAAGDTPIALYAGDVTKPDTLAELDGAVDLVLCNPPYVPSGTDVPPEVADHDPPAAVFAGRDGLDVIRPVVSTAARLLKPGGALAIEHDERHADAVLALLSTHPGLTDVQDHPDLTGRPRFATATRTA